MDQQVLKTLPQNTLSKFFNLESLGNISNSIPVIPGLNTVGGILLAINYSRQEKFLFDIIEERQKITLEDLINKEAFLKRFYLTSQVVAKAQTQEKYEHFKKLLLNSTLFEISDNDYELYNNIIDDLTNEEFVYLVAIYKESKDLQIDREKREVVKQRLESKGLMNSQSIDPSAISGGHFTAFGGTKGVIVKSYSLSDFGKNFIEYLIRE